MLRPNSGSSPGGLILIDFTPQFFVVAAVKVRQPGRLARAIREVRDRTSYGSELKFSSITRGSLTVYYELIAALEASDANLAACVVKGDVYNPFRQRRAVWKVHAEVTSQLLVGCINRRNSSECTWTASPRHRVAPSRMRSAG